MSLVAGHPVGYQSTGSSEQGVGSRRGGRGRLGQEEVGFRERRTGKRGKGRRNREEGKKREECEEKGKEKGPQQKVHRREAASGPISTRGTAGGWGRVAQQHRGSHQGPVRREGPTCPERGVSSPLPSSASRAHPGGSTNHPQSALGSWGSAPLL